MKTKKTATSDAFVTTDLQQQREYAEAKGNDILLIAAETFVRSMRQGLPLTRRLEARSWPVN